MYYKTQKCENPSLRIDSPKSIHSVGVLRLSLLLAACLPMVGHTSLRVSRPVWYAASTAAAGYPAPTFYSRRHSYILVRHPAALPPPLPHWCTKYFGKVHKAFKPQMEFLRCEKMSFCGKLHNQMSISYQPGDWLVVCSLRKKIRKVILQLVF